MVEYIIVKCITVCEDIIQVVGLPMLLEVLAIIGLLAFAVHTIVLALRDLR